MADTRDEAPKRTARAAPDDAAEAERRLARYAAYGIPAATVGTAIVVGFVMSLGPAILVLAAGTLLGVIALLWASLRTLSGEAPLPLELEAMAVRSRKVDDLGERKRRVLRALKDLELEHSVGKIDDKDYASLGDRFRGEAKALMREMDGQIDPLRDEAERIAKKYLAKRGLGEGDAKAEPKRGSDSATAKKPADDDDDDDTDEGDEKPEVEEEAVEEKEAAKPAPAAKAKPAAKARVACSKCQTSNEPDAAFCKKCGTSLAPEKAEKSDA